MVRVESEEGYGLDVSEDRRVHVVEKEVDDGGRVAGEVFEEVVEDVCKCVAVSCGHRGCWGVRFFGVEGGK